MTAPTDANNSNALPPPPAATIVNYDELPPKAPPLLQVGALAWMRANLFSSPLNTLLTFIGALVLASMVVSLVSWAVGDANWLVISFNLRQFMIGRYEADVEWRITATVLLTAGVLGLAVGAFARPRPIVAVVVAVLVALCFVVPLLASPLPLPATTLAAGQAAITTGSLSQVPPPQIGFIARAGETVRLALATDLAASDEALRGLRGFADSSANLLRGAAETRLNTIARSAEIDRLLAEDVPNARTLTSNQRAGLEAEKARLTLTEPVVETRAIHAEPLAWRLLYGAELELVAEGTFTASAEGQTAETVQVQLPSDGWYVLERIGEGTSLLRAEGIYPLLERSFTVSEERDSSGAVTQNAGRSAEYTRITDGWATNAIRPKIDGRDVPMATIIEVQYRGQRTVTDWLTVYLGPFLQQISVPVLLIVLAAVAGFAIARIIDALSSGGAANRNPRLLSQRAAIYTLIALPVLMFVLIYGTGGPLPFTDTRRWGGLLLTILLSIVGIIASFPLGVLLALGRRSALPVVSTASTVYIEFVRGVPLITVLFMAQLLVPLISPTLAEVDNVFRAMVGIILFSAAYLAENVRGGLQAIPPGQEEAARALGLPGWQVTLFVTLPQALRLVIPALVGQFISLFKDTSLVAIVGLTDLTGIAQTTVTQTEFLGTRREAYVFIGFIYFVFCYVMAAVSRRLEASGSGAARRV